MVCRADADEKEEVLEEMNDEDEDITSFLGKETANICNLVSDFSKISIISMTHIAQDVVITLNREPFHPAGTVFALEDVSYFLFLFETDGEKLGSRER